MRLQDPKALAALYRQALLHDVIPFWMRHSPDHECGGYFTCLERDGAVFDTDKFVWLQARQVWMFSKLCNELGARPEWLDLAALGAQFLREHGHDRAGDWYFALDRYGGPLVQPYNIFSDCFAAMAFAEFGRATGEAWATELAVRTFERIQARWDNPKGRYSKAVPGARPQKSLSLPMITVNLALELGSAIPGYDVSGVVDRTMDEVVNLFFDPGRGVIFEHVAPDGSHPDTFDGRLINPGHGIECCWFLMAAARQRQRADLVPRIAEALLGQMEFGWDKANGGFFYFLDVQGHPPQQLEWDQKLWWVHVEALVATVLAWQVTGDPRFAEWYERVHDYTWARFPDPQHGEWFGYLNRRGEVLLPLKGGKWKGCFHVPRALLLCAQWLEPAKGRKG
jgi:N-acylglucosamine 2-epimerase